MMKIIKKQEKYKWKITKLINKIEEDSIMEMINLLKKINDGGKQKTRQ